MSHEIAPKILISVLPNPHSNAFLQVESLRICKGYVEGSNREGWGFVKGSITPEELAEYWEEVPNNVLENGSSVYRLKPRH